MIRKIEICLVLIPAIELMFKIESFDEYTSGVFFDKLVDFIYDNGVEELFMSIYENYCSGHITASPLQLSQTNLI